jgi:hypothetical protein
MQVYADNAATTKVSQTAIDAMLPCLTETYGNPSSVHRFGRAAHEMLENARGIIADCLNADARELTFTSGGSEADNQALISAAAAGERKGKKHIISTAFEHHAILHTLDKLEKQGFEIELLPVYSDGIVHVEDVAAAIREDTALVTIMYANNEIGTIQPIAEIGALCRDRNVLFHTDAVQAGGHIKIDVKEQNIDMLTLSGHKFHAPKGSGVLYVRAGSVPLANVIEGGAQERGKRGGTENIPRHRRYGRRIQRELRQSRRECSQSNGFARPGHRGPGADSRIHLKRSPHAAASREHQLLLQRHRRRSTAAAAGSRRHRRLVGLSLHIGIARSEPCAFVHRSGPRSRAWIAPPFAERIQHRRRSRPHPDGCPLRRRTAPGNVTGVGIHTERSVTPWPRTIATL